MVVVVKQEGIKGVGMFFWIADEESGLQTEGNGDEMDDITNYITFHICTSINKNRKCSASHIRE